MQLKLFTIPIKNVSEAEAEMNGLLRGHANRTRQREASVFCRLGAGDNLSSVLPGAADRMFAAHGVQN